MTGEEGPVKVAVLLTPVEFGGSERVCLNLLRNIDRDRFSVFPILLSRPWEPDNVFAQKLRNEGYVFRDIPVAMRRGEGVWRVVRSYRLLHAYLARGGFDLLHTNGYFADLIGVPAARALGIPCIATCHGFIGNTTKLRFYNWLDRFALRFASRIMAVSEGVYGDLIESGVVSEKVCVVLNAVDAFMSEAGDTQGDRDCRKTPGFSRDYFVVGYVGRLSEEKGVGDLLAAFAEQAKPHPTLRLVIVGEGPQRCQLERWVVDLGIHDRVVFAGFQEDVSTWFRGMDIFVLPSLTEGTPMALLEAMAAGVPVVGTAVGGVPRLIRNGETGILVTPGRPGEIARAVEELIRNGAKRSHLAEGARRLVENEFGVSGWIEKIQSEYLSLCGEK